MHEHPPHPLHRSAFAAPPVSQQASTNCVFESAALPSQGFAGCFHTDPTLAQLVARVGMPRLEQMPPHQTTSTLYLRFSRF